MSAQVCGKRSSSIFEEPIYGSPPPASKRIRCAAGALPPSPDLRTAISGSQIRDACSSEAPLDRLRSLFPDMDLQFLEQILEESGNDLDCAIKSLNSLSLESAEVNSTIKSNVETDISLHTSNDILVNAGGDAESKDPSPIGNIAADGSEWVDLFVREMMYSSDLDDARYRAFRALEVLKSSIKARAGAEAAQSFHQENLMLKQQVETLLQENTILKKAIAIQHERQKEHDERRQEVEHLRQLVAQYQEQIRTLELNNYALAMHLKQAQQNNNFPWDFNPDVF